MSSLAGSRWGAWEAEAGSRDRDGCHLLCHPQQGRDLSSQNKVQVAAKHLATSHLAFHLMPKSWLRAPVSLALSSPASSAEL